MSRHPNTSRALPVVVAFATLLFLVLGIGALGIIGDGDADRIYLAVVAVFVVGTLVAKFRPQPMAIVMLATAATMVACTGVAFVMGDHRSPGASASDMVMLTAMYAGLFAFAAWLFARNAPTPTPPQHTEHLRLRRAPCAAKGRDQFAIRAQRADTQVRGSPFAARCARCSGSSPEPAGGEGFEDLR